MTLNISPVDDDWEDLVPAEPSSKHLPDVTVRRFFRNGKHGAAKRASSQITVRGAMAESLRTASVRVRVQIGGNGDRLRILPDDQGGRYEVTEAPGRAKRTARATAIIRLGFVTAWPNDEREPVEATIRRDPISGGFIVEVPTDFVREAARPRASEPPTGKSAPPQGFTVPAAAHQSRSVVEPGVMAAGVPSPGRSALDQRRATPPAAAGPPSISAARRK